jgi:hypothetical protein
LCNAFNVIKLVRELPEFTDLDLLKIIFSEKKIRPKDITKRIYEMVKKKHEGEPEYWELNKISTNVSRHLKNLTKDGVIDREKHRAKVWYIATRKTQSEIFRLTLQHAKIYKFGYEGLWMVEGKPTFFFEPLDPEVVSKILELMKKGDKETEQFVKFLMSLMRFVVQGLVFSKDGKAKTSVDFYKPQNKLFFTGNFPGETSLLIKDVIERGIFKDYNHFFKALTSPMIDFLGKIEQEKENPRKIRVHVSFSR